MIDVQAIGIDDFQRFAESFPHVADKAALIAVNQIADRTARVGLKREILKEVAFPSSYLNKERLGVKRRATSARLEAIVAGRDRPTSLARFVVGGERALRSRRGNIKVQVKPGSQKPLKNAFGVQLKNGNVGLAVRSKNGIRNSHTGGVQIGRGVFLLYAPSVDQVMPGAVDVVAPNVATDLTQEFLRQFKRLSK